MTSHNVLASFAVIRAIFKEACVLAGLPYFNPQSIQNALVQMA